MSLAHSLESFLDRRGVRYTLEHHAISMCSLETARVAHVDEGHLAKSVVLEDDQGFVLAVLPASRRVELGRVRTELGRALRLSSEHDMRRLFPDCATGAVPPIGSVYGIPTVVDASFETCDEVFFEGGDHETLVRMGGDEFLDLLENADVVEIASESESLAAALATRERLYDALLAVGNAIGAPVAAGTLWRRRLRRELAGLIAALDEHTEETEGVDGVLAAICEQAPRLSREVNRLRDEHRTLKISCARISASVEAGESSLAIRRDTHRLLSQFDQHRHRGADLVYAAFSIDLGGG